MPTTGEPEHRNFHGAKGTLDCSKHSTSSGAQGLELVTPSISRDRPQTQTVIDPRHSSLSGDVTRRVPIPLPATPYSEPEQHVLVIRDPTPPRPSDRPLLSRLRSRRLSITTGSLQPLKPCVCQVSRTSTHDLTLVPSPSKDSDRFVSSHPLALRQPHLDRPQASKRAAVASSDPTRVRRRKSRPSVSVPWGLLVSELANTLP